MSDLGLSEPSKIPAGVLFHTMLTKERLDEALAYDPETGLFTWRVRPNRRIRIGDTAGSVTSTGHIQIMVGGKLRLAHRLAFLTMTGALPENEVDHINGDPADNRWANLRPATRVENLRNRGPRRDNSSGVPGVYWHAARGKWQAHITVSRKNIHLGCFARFDDAVAARRAAEVKYFGEFSATVSRTLDAA